MSNTKKIHTDEDQTDENLEPQEDVQAEQIQELNNKYLRALADYQNLEKRMVTAVEQARSHTERHVINRFIDLLDDMEKAEVFVQDQGLSMIMARFRQILQEAGVTELDVLGEPFDPYTAEAIDVVPGDIDNIVTDVVRKGYKIGDTVIRPAHVKVSKITS